MLLFSVLLTSKLQMERFIIDIEFLLGLERT